MNLCVGDDFRAWADGTLMALIYLVKVIRGKYVILKESATEESTLVDGIIP